MQSQSSSSRTPIAERKLHYLIRGDTTYINFVRLDEPTDPSAWTNLFSSTALLPTAVVRFKGPFSRTDHRTMLDLKWFGNTLHGPNAAEKLKRLTEEAKAACEAKYP